MALTIELPGALRELAGGRSKVVLGGAGGDPGAGVGEASDTGEASGTGEARGTGEAPRTVGAALDALRREFPAVYDRIVTERGEVRTHVNLFVGVEEIRHTGGLATRVGPEDRIVVLPAVSGG
ncbi:MAG: MoaD/ThiS family protein [Gemmatimonadota bacterium]